jgi:hypothetical protein
MGRPSCQPSLLSDPNANFSVEMSRRSNIRRAATSALTFYDLLIEANHELPKEELDVLRILNHRLKVYVSVTSFPHCLQTASVPAVARPSSVFGLIMHGPSASGFSPAKYAAQIA